MQTNKIDDTENQVYPALDALLKVHDTFHADSLIPYSYLIVWLLLWLNQIKRVIRTKVEEQQT